MASSASLARHPFKVGMLAGIPINTSGPLVLVRVRIEDVREVYGRIDFKVSPSEGSGSMWVSESRMYRDPCPEVSAEINHPLNRDLGVSPGL